MAERTMRAGQESRRAKKGSPGKKKSAKAGAGKNKRNEAEPQYYNSAANIPALNYHVYTMSAAEKIVCFLIGFAVGAIVAYVFYGGLAKDAYDNPTTATYIIDAIVMAVLGILAGRLFVRERGRSLLAKRQHTLRVQFRDLLESLATNIGAGRNVQDALTAAYADLQTQYEEGSYILNEIYIILAGVQNGARIDEMFGDLGRRSGNVDIENFANVFSICTRQGGNIRETIRNTCEIISDKMAISEDIETTVTSSKSELKLMLVLPILMVLLIKQSSQDFAQNFASPAGIASTTAGLVLVVVAYFIGQKILDIKI